MVAEKSGDTVRGGRRAYYRMPDPESVERALRDVRQRHLDRSPE